MIYTVNISNQAETDLREIYEYIAYDLQAPENASGQLDRLEKCILSLSQQPERFRTYDTEPWKSRGLRIVPVNNYCVFIDLCFLRYIAQDCLWVFSIPTQCGTRAADRPLIVHILYFSQREELWQPPVQSGYKQYLTTGRRKQ